MGVEFHFGWRQLYHVLLAIGKEEIPVTAGWAADVPAGRVRSCAIRATAGVHNVRALERAANKANHDRVILCECAKWSGNVRRQWCQNIVGRYELRRALVMWGLQLSQPTEPLILKMSQKHMLIQTQNTKMPNATHYLYLVNGKAKKKTAAYQLQPTRPHKQKAKVSTPQSSPISTSIPSSPPKLFQPYFHSPYRVPY
jgi:hypothetical protein